MINNNTAALKNLYHGKNKLHFGKNYNNNSVNQPSQNKTLNSEIPKKKYVNYNNYINKKIRKIKNLFSNNTTKTTSHSFKIKQGSIKDCTLIAAINALYLNGNLQKLVSEDKDGKSLISIGNKKYRVNRSDLIKQYFTSLIPALADDSLIPEIECAYGQYLLDNYNPKDHTVTLTDVNNQKFKYKVTPINPKDSPTKQAFQLLDNASYIGHVYALLNNIPFKQITETRLKSPSLQEINSYFESNDKKTTFININNNNSVQTALYSLETKHAYQVVPLDWNNEKDLELVKEYNTKSTKQLQQGSQIYKIYKLINPQHTSKYDPHQSKYSKLLSAAHLKDALKDSNIWVFQINNEPATKSNLPSKTSIKNKPTIGTRLNVTG